MITLAAALGLGCATPAEAIGPRVRDILALRQFRSLGRLQQDEILAGLEVEGSGVHTGQSDAITDVTGKMKLALRNSFYSIREQ